MPESHVDILNIVGIDHVTFYNSGEDVNLRDEDDQKPSARVFRRGGKLVYRSGAVDWYGEDQKPGH